MPSTYTTEDDILTHMKALRERTRQRLLANRDYIALIALDNAIAQVEGGSGSSGSVTIRDNFVSSIGAIRTNRPITQADAALKVLDAIKRPLPTAALMERAKALGAEVGGKDPAVNFGSSLSRDQRFQNLRNWQGQRAWWFADRPVPAEPSAFDIFEESEPADTPSSASAGS